MLDKSELWVPQAPKDSPSPQRVQRAFKAVYRWTGLPGKTLWDIFQLIGMLAIPVVVVIASSQFSMQQNQANLFASEQQHQTDIQIATEQQHEAALQNYLETISGLLLNNKLIQSNQGDAVREVARVQTLTTLRRLDPTRKGILLRFLYESGLIGGVRESGSSNIMPTILSLSGADLTGINLSGTDLNGVNLSGTHLDHIDLSGADLDNANLSGADLSDARLITTRLRGDRPEKC